MNKSIDQQIYERAFKPSHAVVLADLMALMRRIDSRHRQAGRPGVFETHFKKKQGGR